MLAPLKRNHEVVDRILRSLKGSPGLLFQKGEELKLESYRTWIGLVLRQTKGQLLGILHSRVST